MMKKWIVSINIFVFCFFSLNLNAQDSLNLKEIEKGVDKYLTYFSDTNPGAVVAVMKKGNIIFNKAYGLSNIDTGEKLTVDQLFNIDEISKSFTSTAIMNLVENGKLNLDQNLKQIFPDFPNYGEKIKIRNLLNHTSGLPTYNKNEVRSNDQVYELLKKEDSTIFEPGTNWKYCNSDYAILVNVIEKVSGMSYEDFLNKTIFKKLKMGNTYFLGENIKEKIADGHVKVDKEYKVMNFENLVLGEQGIFTTSSDFAKWDKSLYTNKILKCESLEKIFTVENLDLGKKISNYGYGWALMEKDGVRYYWHGGVGNGYSSLVLHLPDIQMTVLILTNRNDGFDFLKMSIYIAKLFDKNLKL